MIDSKVDERTRRSGAEPLFPDQGPTFVTFELVERSRGTLEYLPTKKSLTFRAIFTGLGLLACLVGSVMFILSRDLIALVGLPAGLVFFVIGSQLTTIANATRTFDAVRRIVTLPSHLEKNGSPHRSFSFDEIDHLQIVEKLLDGGEDRDYSCYELNVVLKAGARVLIVQHSDKAVIIADGERLAALVGCALQIQDPETAC